MCLCVQTIWTYSVTHKILPNTNSEKPKSRVFCDAANCFVGFIIYYLFISCFSFSKGLRLVYIDFPEGSDNGQAQPCVLSHCCYIISHSCYNYILRPMTSWLLKNGLRISTVLGRMSVRCSLPESPVMLQGERVCFFWGGECPMYAAPSPEV